MSQHDMGTAENENPGSGAEPTATTEQPVIECCIDNVSVEEVQNYEAGSTPVEMRYCLQRCGRCYDQAFLVIDGDVIPGPNHAALRDRLDSEEDRHA
jgi:uncharacterized protein YuzB (UPF0349 family)